MIAPLPAAGLVVSTETRPFWEGCAAGELRLQWCGRCGSVIWYPRTHCPECMSRDLHWRVASGAGQIYSWTRVARGSGVWSETRSYLLAIVELAEGPRILTNLYADDDQEVAVGAAVAVVFDPALESEFAIPRFRLTN